MPWRFISGTTMATVKCLQSSRPEHQSNTRDPLSLVCSLLLEKAELMQQFGVKRHGSNCLLTECNSIMCVAYKFVLGRFNHGTVL